MATQKQRHTARRNVKKAQAGARSKQTLKHLSGQTRTALGKEANAVRRGESPTRKEDHGEVVDAIETAHLLTLGLAYESDGRLAGSAFEPILKKCDGFLDKPLKDAYEIREQRAGKVLEAAKHVKAVEDALKAKGTFHSMARYQIISSANPTKRARKPSDFDKTFDKFIANLEQLEESPEKVLREKVE